MASPSRLECLAAIIVSAFRAVFGREPTRAEAWIAIAIAEYEATWDAGFPWTGDHNFGATHRGSLSAQELEVLHASGVVPSIDRHRGGEDGRSPAERSVDAARRALAEAVGRGEIPPRDTSYSLHVDSRGGRGYFVYFWRFATNYDGAVFFLRTLYKQRPEVLSAAASDDVKLVSELMYRSCYYDGFAEPTPCGHRGDELTPNDWTNINDYAAGIAKHLVEIGAALGSSWSAGQALDEGCPERWSAAGVRTPPPLTSITPVASGAGLGAPVALGLAALAALVLWALTRWGR